MKTNLFNVLLLLFCSALTPGCKHSQQNSNLREGDLLFQDLNCGDLCDAIEAVTKGVDGKKFSHCAMVININDTIQIVEAIGDKVQLNSIKNFFSRSGDTSTINNITVARVNPQFETLIHKAIQFAKIQIGQPYDNEFLLDNGKWYCSELLYQSFKEANNQTDFFELEPMTFIDKKTNLFFPAWVDYYKQINTEIPEGKAGINPGLISRSSKIQIIKINSFNDINDN